MGWLYPHPSSLLPDQSGRRSKYELSVPLFGARPSGDFVSATPDLQGRIHSLLPNLIFTHDSFFSSYKVCVIYQPSLSLDTQYLQQFQVSPSWWVTIFRQELIQSEQLCDSVFRLLPYVRRGNRTDLEEKVGLGHSALYCHQIPPVL
jgi:hypothetical protein